MRRCAPCGKLRFYLSVEFAGADALADSAQHHCQRCPSCITADDCPSIPTSDILTSGLLVLIDFWGVHFCALSKPPIPCGQLYRQDMSTTQEFLTSKHWRTSRCTLELYASRLDEILLIRVFNGISVSLSWFPIDVPVSLQLQTQNNLGGEQIGTTVHISFSATTSHFCIHRTLTKTGKHTLH